MKKSPGNEGGAIIKLERKWKDERNNEIAWCENEWRGKDA